MYFVLFYSVLFYITYFNLFYTLLYTVLDHLLNIKLYVLCVMYSQVIICYTLYILCHLTRLSSIQILFFLFHYLLLSSVIFCYILSYSVQVCYYCKYNIVLYPCFVSKASYLALPQYLSVQICRTAQSKAKPCEDVIGQVLSPST